MKKLILILGILCITHALYAQIESPVKWSYAAKRSGKNEAVIFIKATIDEGWHIYSINEPDGGPVKTSFKFKPAKTYQLIGKVTEPKPLTKYEDAFDITTKYFDGTVIFQQKIRLRSAKAVITGRLKYMVCNARQCLPPDEVNFQVPIN